MPLSSVRVVSPPGAVGGPWQWPVTIDEARAHLRLSGTTEDAYVRGLIYAATGLAEEYTGRAIGVQVLEADFDWRHIDLAPSAARPAALPRPPHVLPLAVLDVDGGAVEEEGYVFRRVGDGVRLVRADLDDGVTVRYLAGYAKPTNSEADLHLQGTYECAAPAAIKQAVLLTIADLYEVRGETVIGTIVGKMPVTAESLLFSYKLFDA